MIRKLMLLAALLAPLSAFGAGDGPAGATAFVGATVIDGTGGSPRANATVLVTGGRIEAVGGPGEVDIPPAVRVVDARGKWIVPGLVDAHVHFFQSGGLYTRPDIIDLRKTRPYADEVAWIKQRLPDTFARYLASGVTAVADFGGPFWNFQVRRLAGETLAAPRVAVAGPLIATYLPPELKTDDPPLIEVDSPGDARAVVRRELACQPDLIKIWFIPRAGQDLAAQAEWIRAAIEESHAAGVRVAVHATQLEIARAAVKAGADILAHSVDDSLVDDDFVALLKARKVVYVTTLAVNEGYREVLGQAVRLTDIERRLGDPQVVATFADLDRLPAWETPYWARWPLFWPSQKTQFANLKRLQQSGVAIAAGTDAGNIGTLHGPALHRELALMAEAGLSPQAILAAATRGGAQVMGRESELGTLEKGKLADLLLLDADPLADIANLRRIDRVVKGGVVLDPEKLVKAR